MNFNLTHILSIKRRNILTIRKQTLATRLYIFGLFIAFIIVASLVFVVDNECVYGHCLRVYHGRNVYFCQ